MDATIRTKTTVTDEDGNILEEHTGFGDITEVELSTPALDTSTYTVKTEILEVEVQA